MTTSSNGNIFCISGPLRGNSPVTGVFPAERPVTLSFEVLFHLRLSKRWTIVGRHCTHYDVTVMWGIYLDWWGHDCKKMHFPTFVHEVGQMTHWRWSSNLICLATYWMYILSVKTCLKTGWKKPGKSDRRMDGHWHGTIRLFFKQACKNLQTVVIDDEKYLIK